MADRGTHHAGAPRRAASWVASLAIHGGIAAVIALLPPQVMAPKKLTPIELTDRELERPKPPPPPPEPPKPKAEEPKPEPAPEPPPKKVVRRQPRKQPPPKPPAEPPPSEPQEPPSDKPPDTGPKTFGLTLEGTTTAAPGEGVAVPQGDSMAVAPTIRKRGKKKVENKKPTGFKKTYQRGEMAPVAVITTRPRVLKRVQADYPERMRELGIEGRVVLELTIDADGNVINIKVLKSLRPELDEAAKAAARKMRFAPATVSGTAVKVKIPYTFTFVLD